jgi:hypothetical protein
MQTESSRCSPYQTDRPPAEKRYAGAFLRGSVAAPSRPGTEERMFAYKLYLVDGDEIGEASYIEMIQPDEEILYGNGRRFRVLDVAPFDEADESRFVAMLKVEAA